MLPHEQSVGLALAYLFWETFFVPALLVHVVSTEVLNLKYGLGMHVA